MERPRIRPEDRTRIPDLYEVIMKDKGGIKWVGVRFTSDYLSTARRIIKPPYYFAPITFKDQVPPRSMSVNKTVA